MKKYPFDYDPAQSYVQQAGDWIADVFYEQLPAAGFEVRDEQIYMAFQLERAFAEKRPIFAEAGVGTGKTLVYLLYAIAYARYMRQPAIIACADESLIEQLVKPQGDVAKLARHLDLTVDARLGKSPDQYLCLVKLDQAIADGGDDELYDDIHRSLPEFVRKPKPLQAFHPYGDRRDYSHLNDEQWSRVNWDAFQDCFVCEQRHRCGQTLSRDHYRRAADLIICSHDFYMEHVWTYEGRKREGQLPLLPEHSSIVFDEGHLLEAAAQKALTYNVKHRVFTAIITRLLQNAIRESLALLIEDAIEQSDLLFDVFASRTTAIAGSERLAIQVDALLLREIKRFCSLLSAIEEELVYESGLYTLADYQLRIVEEHLEMLQTALRLFERPEPPICWGTESSDGLAVAIMPKAVKEVLRERVFAAPKPIVFSSATLSTEGSFGYVADSLGIDDYLSFTVASPYDYRAQMEVQIPKWSEGGSFREKLQAAAERLAAAGGRTLLLFSSREEMLHFKQAIAEEEACRDLKFYVEGDQEISTLIERFQEEETSCLCAISLWEGLDVPGPSLSQVIIWSLPFPPQDPVYMAKRQDASDPFHEVDLPYMLLRLRQGLGRLIRSREDRGSAAIFVEIQYELSAVQQRIASVLPMGKPS
ncbi:ATP-dependent DNA helicase [Paenibacillus sp. 1P07SE]|uniref:ATP-dependent DNA helicase n=1 Tax=Paenibacillus sp. 1P07SE TaxID=3132209 RepID=UPI0039A6087E